MRHVLSKGSVLRHEWFGCLLYQTYSGSYLQFNEDAFEILHRLATPMTIEELRNALRESKMTIGKKALRTLLLHYEELGVTTRGESASEVTIFYKEKGGFRRDCLIAPSSVTLYTTDFCTKRCRHCATDSGPSINHKDELSLNDWTKIIRKLRTAGVISLVISGGEPLAIPHTLELLKIADRMQFGLTLLTDFDYISERQIIELKSLKHSLHIQTSLDGATPESHDFLRGEGSFRKTIRRLRLLKDSGIVFTVAVSVHKKNIGELDQIAEVANQNGASYIYLNAVAPYGRAKRLMKGLILNDEELKYVAQTCLRWTAEGKISTRNPFWSSNLSHLGDKEFHPLSGTLNAMSLGIYNFTINSKGECYLDAKQRAERFLMLGNILEKDLLAMWNDPRLDRLRIMHAKKNFTFAEQSEIETALS